VKNNVSFPSISDSFETIPLKIQNPHYNACATNGANFAALFQNQDQFA